MTGPLSIGSLFSGIGGLELGLERAGLGPVLWQCERSEYCRRVLAAHWPDVKRYDDVTTLDVHAPRVGLVCGGFPCQGVSDSEGAGLADARSGLWYEMLRVVRLLRPRIVVVENVANLALRGLDVVLAGLAESGFDAEWLPLRASDLGAPHGRLRLFIVAYAHGDRFVAEPEGGLHVRGEHGPDADGRRAYPPGPFDGEAAWRAYAGAGGPEPGLRRGADGFPSRLDRDRLAALGNAVAPDCAETVGHFIRARLRAASEAA